MGTDQPRDAERRVRCYLASHEMLRTLFHEGATTRVMRGLPEGARILGIYEDYRRAALAVMAEHPSFDVVPLGAEAPTFTIAVERVDEAQL